MVGVVREHGAAKPGTEQRADVGADWTKDVTVDEAAVTGRESETIDDDGQRGDAGIEADANGAVDGIGGDYFGEDGSDVEEGIADKIVEHVG